MKSKNECLFCESTECHTRVWNKMLAFDEVACDVHKEKLLEYADEQTRFSYKVTESDANLKRK